MVLGTNTGFYYGFWISLREYGPLNLIQVNFANSVSLKRVCKKVKHFKFSFYFFLCDVLECEVWCSKIQPCYYATSCYSLQGAMWWSFLHPVPGRVEWCSPGGGMRWITLWSTSVVPSPIAFLLIMLLSCSWKWTSMAGHVPDGISLRARPQGVCKRWCNLGGCLFLLTWPHHPTCITVATG